MYTNEQILTIRNRLDALRGTFDLSSKHQKLELQEKKTFQENFWENSSEAQITLKRIKFLKNWIKILISLKKI